MLLIGGPKQFGRKEPSMMIIGCDSHPSWQQICWLDTVTGETGEKPAEARSPGCRAYFEIAAGRTVSADLDSVQGREGSAAAVDPSLQAGADSRAGEDRTAASGDEPGHHQEAKAVEQSGRESAARASLEALGQPAARRPVQDKRDVEWADRPARPSRGGSRGEERKSAAADDAAGSGADHFDGLCADHGRCFPFSAWEAGGELFGADSAGVQFGRTSTVRIDQQAGEPLHENAASRSGARGGALRSRYAFGVFASLSPESARSRQGGGGKEVGDSTLLDAAHQYRVSRGRSCREQLAGAGRRPPRRIDRRIDWALSSR